MTCLDDDSRRRFLSVSSMLLVAGVASACTDTSGESASGGESSGGDGDGDGDAETGSEGSTSADTSSSATSDTSDSSATSDTSTSADATDESGGEVCEETPPQTAGPFPQAGLERNDFDLYGHAGVPFVLRGRVLDADCEPVSNAQVLLWHATPSAPGVVPATLEADPQYVSSVYDHANQAGALTPDGATIPTGEQMYYGWTTTDADGQYMFTTLRPGWYLNGSTYRPAHLHVRIFVDGTELLTTQLYFPDDPFNDADGILQSACDAETCFVVYEDEAGAEGTFDLHVNV